MRTINQLRKALAEAAEPNTELLNEARARCRKDSVLFDAAIMGHINPPIVRKAWADFAAQHPEQLPERREGEWFPREQSPADFELQLLELATRTHYIAKDGNERYAYPIEDAARRIVGQGTGLNSPTNTEIGDIAAQWRNTLEEDACKIASVDHARKLLNTLLVIVGNTDDPVPALYAQPDDSGWAFARRTIDADPTVAYPSIARILAAMNDPEAFAAKLYAIAYGLDTSRQALYLRGEGKDGKSSFLRAFVKVIGERVSKSITGVHVSQSSKFLAAEYKNCALVYSPDNQNPAILLTEVVKSITGDDKVSYEKKYGGFGEYNSQAKLVIFSNHRPKVLDERHSLSRILYIEMTKPDYDDVGVDAFSRACEAEMPGFLAYGRECFERRWANNMIELNDDAQEALEALVADTSFDWNVFFDEHLTMDAAGALTQKELSDLLKESRLSKYEREEFRTKLTKLEGINFSPASATDRKRVYRGVRRRIPADLSARTGGMADA